MEPTKEQIQRFWEQCGFQKAADRFDPNMCEVTGEYWYPVVQGEEVPYRDAEPPIDLNNLFKYAVPKLTRYDLWCNTRWDEETRGVVQDDCGALAQIGFGNKITGFGTSTDKDPTLALFWAIYKALGGKDG